MQLPPNLADELHKIISGKIKKRELKTPSLAQIRGLLEGSTQPRFKVGDYVTLRPHAKGIYNCCEEGGEYLISQVLDVPYRAGDSSTSKCATLCDVAIVFIDEDGDIVEYLVDSRNFKSLGTSIYDLPEMDF